MLPSWWWPIALLLPIVPVRILIGTGAGWVYYSFSLILMASAVVAFATLVLVTVLMLLNRENRFERFDQLRGTVALSVLVAIVLILAIGGARFWLEAITHAPALERRLLGGHWTTRCPFAISRFAVVGPQADPAAAPQAGAGRQVGLDVGAGRELQARVQRAEQHLGAQRAAAVRPGDRGQRGLHPVARHLFELRKFALRGHHLRARQAGDHQTGQQPAQGA